MSKTNSYTTDQQYTSEQSLLGGQYCTFEISPYQNCLQFRGFSHSTELMSWNSCDKRSLDLKIEQTAEYEAYLVKIENLLMDLYSQGQDNKALKNIEMYEKYLKYARQHGYGHTSYEYPMKPKNKAKLVATVFSVFWGAWIFWNLARKCCPSAIEWWI